MMQTRARTRRLCSRPRTPRRSQASRVRRRRLGSPAERVGGPVTSSPDPTPGQSAAAGSDPTHRLGECGRTLCTPEKHFPSQPRSLFPPSQTPHLSAVTLPPHTPLQSGRAPLKHTPSHPWRNVGGRESMRELRSVVPCRPPCAQRTRHAPCRGCCRRTRRSRLPGRACGRESGALP